MQQKIVSYKVVEEKDATALENTVNKLIGDGWVPQGGVFLFQDGYFCQAMVRFSADAGGNR